MLRKFLGKEKKKLKQIHIFTIQKISIFNEKNKKMNLSATSTKQKHISSSSQLDVSQGGEPQVFKANPKQPTSRSRFVCHCVVSLLMSHS
jgi:hypothetical protein